MGRWEPDARGRLAEAALELYSERGYEQTTVAEIAGRAGLTERTFFRHYADKREVLFGGSDLLQDLFVNGVAGTPLSAAPVDALTAGLTAACAVFTDRRDLARRRQAVIAANRELRERELTKLATLSAAAADALRGRGVGEPAASLTAEMGVAVFKVGFARWIAADDERELGDWLRESLDGMRDLTAGGRAEP
ncbi:TetR/AcrR family transcriptional regulator [Streptomyces sp. NPDC006012]|uniref:TetR/AcrR family transcriptional regulator n=1 Tax=Streptomyces sp. NPDC006012 TaxID=3364739 RepID=UPI0036904E03